MKKVLIVALVLLASVSMSLAGMGIMWDNGASWMVEYGGDVNDGPGLLENNSAIWQLIYAGANDTADEPDLSAANYLGGDDQLLADRQIAQGGGSAADGTAWTDWLELNSQSSTQYSDPNWTTAGYVYQRVWQGTPSAEVDSYYYQTGLFEIDTTYAGGSAIPQMFSYDDANAGVAIDNVIPGEGPGPQPQVPEPATMSLLGLGALAMVLRRKMSK